MIPEQPVIIERICAVQINLQFSSKVLKFGTLFLFQSFVRQTFLALRRKCKNFYLNNHWIGLGIEMLVTEIYDLWPIDKVRIN